MGNWNIDHRYHKGVHGGDGGVGGGGGTSGWEGGNGLLPPLSDISGDADISKNYTTTTIGTSSTPFGQPGFGGTITAGGIDSKAYAADQGINTGEDNIYENTKGEFGVGGTALTGTSNTRLQISGNGGQGYYGGSGGVGGYGLNMTGAGGGAGGGGSHYLNPNHISRDTSYNVFPTLIDRTDISNCPVDQQVTNIELTLNAAYTIKSTEPHGRHYKSGNYSGTAYEGFWEFPNWNEYSVKPFYCYERNSNGNIYGHGSLELSWHNDVNVLNFNYPTDSDDIPIRQSFVIPNA